MCVLRYGLHLSSLVITVTKGNKEVVLLLS
jgi:hypothetical protein